MPPAIMQRPLEFTAPSVIARPRAWRPFPRDLADILCVDEPAGDIEPRIHGRFAIALVRSPMTVRVESSRSVVADQNSVLLVPAWQLYAMRTRGGLSRGVLALLLEPSQLEGVGFADEPSLIVDGELGAQVRSLIAQLRRPVRSGECTTAVRSLVERLATRATPTPGTRTRSAASRLVAVRDHLRANLGEQVKIAELARRSGLTESHLIRAFHQEIGLPPHAYHLRLRLAAASELLADGLSVSTAAYECGFADQSHLSRKFKEVYGLTPGTWATAVADPPRPDAFPDAALRQ